MNEINFLLKKIETIRKHHLEIESILGEDFNVFKVIGLTTEEVRLHSAFLAELLNPKGSHGQKEIFLKLFLSQFNIEDFDYENAFVELEHNIGQKSGEGIEAKGGRIDIYIKDNKGNDIIIENKIDASDQPDQLMRYYNYSKKNVFYLTKNGRDASKESAHNLVSGKDYVAISYEKDIINWLEACKKESVNQPLLREGITHYINLIKYLTNQSTNKAMSEEIVKTILESTESISVASEIARNFNNAKGILQKKFWKVLISALLEKGLEIENLEEFKKSLGYKVWSFYNSDRNREKNYGLRVLAYPENDLSIYWECRVDDNSFYSGFTLKKGGKTEKVNNEENKMYREWAKECDENYDFTSDWWLGKQSTNPKLDFYAFNSKEIFILVNEEKLKEIVNDIANKAVQDIDKFKSIAK
jgi:hypothetical protein